MEVTVRKLVLIFVLLALTLVACGGAEGEDKQAEQKEEPAPAAGVTGDAAAGETLFNQTVIGSQPGCIICHSLEHDKVLVGPSLADVVDHAAEHAPGMPVEAYLRQSILEPDAFAVEGFAADVMPAALANELSEQQVADLVAFLLTLKK
jgi:cytochrome c551/c552